MLKFLRGRIVLTLLAVERQVYTYALNTVIVLHWQALLRVPGNAFQTLFTDTVTQIQHYWKNVSSRVWRSNHE